jgi:hypothetical protein
MHLFHTPVSTPLLIALTIVYAICAAITTFDTRIIQAKKHGYLRESDAQVPSWTGLFGILLWATWVAIFLLSWWYALLLFVIKFVLKVLPVLENIGALLLTPLVGMKTASAVNIVAREQKKAAKELKNLNNNLKK